MNPTKELNPMTMHRNGLRRLAPLAVLAAACALAGTALARSAAAPQKHGRPADQRHREGGLDADGVQRHVDERADELRLPVAPLLVRRARLRRHHGRDEADL